MNDLVANPGALERLARRIGGLGTYQPVLAARADRLADRLASQRFHIAVLGEFKRGKSTLVNALIGRPVLPSGVVPLTTVATEVHFGSSGTTVVFNDGRQVAISPGTIGDFVTELGNPSNRLGVSHVEVGVEPVFGVPGLVLVDTPGVASVNEQNTVAAHDALLESDGAVVVLSADSPLSESEQTLLAELGQRQAKVFVVINKADHLSFPELDEVRAFVTGHVHRLLGEAVDPYCVAARLALDAAAAAVPAEAAADGEAGEDAGDGLTSFTAFRDALGAFVRDDLASARYASAIGELARLGAGLAESVQVEEATAGLSLETLTVQVHRFESAAHEGRRLLEEDCVLLDHEVAEIASELGRTLAEDAARVAQDRRPLLAPIAAALPFRQLDSGLRDAIELSVREGFEPVRRTAQQRVEASWGALAGRFGARVQERVDDLRTTANEIFDVHLPVVPVPAVGEQRQRFSYLFSHIESPNALIGHVLRLLLPTRRARRRVLRLAQRRLTEEFDKHAGRARYDIAERLSTAKERFVNDMTAEFEQTEASIVVAVGRVRSILQMTTSEQALAHHVRSEAMAIAGEVAEVVARV
ncbi:MAG: dynamin family protein [Acidimicrobiales bacterium]